MGRSKAALAPGTDKASKPWTVILSEATPEDEAEVLSSRPAWVTGDIYGANLVIRGLKSAVGLGKICQYVQETAYH